MGLGGFRGADGQVVLREGRGGGGVEFSFCVGVRVFIVGEGPGN